MKKTSRKTGFQLSFKVVALVLAVALGVWYLSAAKLKNQKPVPQTAIAELSPQAKQTGMGSATKLLNTTDYEIYVTAFLGNLSSGQNYFVWVRSEKDINPSVKLLGKMEKSGDIYSFNYLSKEDYSAYSEIVITKQTEADAKSVKISNEILSGKFKK